MSNSTSRICNWSEYNKALVQRGSITLWIDPAVWSKLSVQPKRGHPFVYPHELIEAALVLKQVYQLSFRALQGFLGSIGEWLGMASPDYSTLCRRQRTVRVSLKRCYRGEKLDLVIDSTGLKIYGEGEWCVKKHGKSRQRTWRKVHLGIDAQTRQIHSCELSGARVQDAQVIDALLAAVEAPLDHVTGDGAYDTFGCYEAVVKRGALPIFPPRKDARLSEHTPYHKKAASPLAIAIRDHTIEQVHTHGRAQWKVMSGYHKRSLAETTMYRLKTLLGERLHSKLIAHQHLELRLRCHILNRMIQLGKPQYTTL